MRHCKDCSVELNSENCYLKSDGFFRSYCKKCHNNRSKNYDKISRKKPHRRLFDSKKQRLDRQDPKHLVKIILQDSRRSDVKNNRINSLTKDFVKSIIEKPCFYCGESEIRMTLDRIDNNIGHTDDNVVQACIRCNYTRRSMPYQAWLCLTAGMRDAREKGLFGNWTGRCR